MALGLGVLGLAPSIFWAMTPAELNAAVEGRLGLRARAAMALGKGELAELMRRFPD